MTTEDYVTLIGGMFIGFMIAVMIFVAFRPWNIEEIRLDNYDNTDIIIDVSGAGGNVEIETNNLSLAERKEWVKKLSSLIAEIKEANRGVEEKK